MGTDIIYLNNFYCRYQILRFHCKISNIMGDAEVKGVYPKLLKVLKKLLQPKLKLHNDDYLNLLLTHLTKSEDTPDPLTPDELKNIDKLLVVWLKGAIMQFEKLSDAPNSNILAFVLNITKHLSRNEQVFVELNSEDLLDRLLTITKRVSQPTVMVALIKLFSDIMDHKSGLQWIISTNHWELLIDVILNNGTIYVMKEGNMFMYKLLEKSIAFNTTFCKNLIQHVLMPLDDATKSMSENPTARYDTKLLFSTLQLLNEVLTILLKHSGNNNENSLILLFIKNYQLEKRIRELIKLTKDTELKAELMKFIIFFSLYDYKSKFSGLRTVPVEKTDVSATIFFDLLYEAATELSVLYMLKLLHVALKSWVGIKATMPLCINQDKKFLTIEDQILTIHMVPVLAVFVKILGVQVYLQIDNAELEDEYRFNFVSNFMGRVNPRTIRVNYKWLRYLLDNFSMNNGILALKFLIHSKHLYNKESAILAFQFMVYLTHDLTCFLKQDPQLQIAFTTEPDYLALYLNVMLVIIDEFDVTWQDSIETMGVLKIMYNLLNGMIWPTKIVVNALKLAEKAISKYMTFQMALLIDDTENSAMNEFPPLLVVKLVDGAWEIRDSTIELICQFAKIANNTKFSSIKKLMLENDFPVLMVQMATNDGNPFVRSSAMKCLQEIIKDETFWAYITSKCDIFATILNILQVETEGIVRSQAATLVDTIYEHQEIPDELMPKFYDSMSHAVVADLHWEVRVNAIKFWKRVIDNHLTQQGMIDDSFPSVTFSKQLKKIVTLSPVEVRKRLVTVLHELSQIGCLSVFYEAIQDESDLEVCKAAVEAVSAFVGFLKQYEVFSHFFQTQSLPSPASSTGEPRNKSFPIISESTLDIELSSVSHSSPSLSIDSSHYESFSNSPLNYEPISDSVMEQILDTKDLNLLESVLNTLDTPAMEHIETKKYTVLSPTAFLELVSNDLESRIGEKTKFVQGIDNFHSLLDDILKEYDHTDVNSMDCY